VRDARAAPVRKKPGAKVIAEAGCSKSCAMSWKISSRRSDIDALEMPDVDGFDGQTSSFVKVTGAALGGLVPTASRGSKLEFSARSTGLFQA